MGLKTKELQPTKENLIKTLKEDAIHRNGLLRIFVAILNAIEESCSIAIDGKWGDGKTFFVKQAKMVIDSCNPLCIEELSEEEKKEVLSVFEQSDYAQEINKPQVTVYYDAWRNDNDTDPLLSLVYEIGQSALISFPNVNTEGFIDKAAAIADAVTGREIKAAIESLKGEDPLKTIKEQKLLEEQISSFLNMLLPERGNRLVVFVDELDRCKPSYAVQLLERIKHYFNNDKVTVVFSINTKELQHSIRKFYGAELDANKYLDRFFDYRISLPDVDMDNYLASIDIRNESNSFDQVCKLVVSRYGLSMREAEKYLRIAYIAGYSISHRSGQFAFDETYGDNFGYMVVLPIIIGLRMVNIDNYNDFIRGNNPQPLLDVLLGYDRSPRLCSNLLERGETFDSIPKTDQTTVLLEDKLKNAYSAIFNNDSKYETKHVGLCGFRTSLKDNLIEVASMLSPYATFSD